jgi:AcrR family transcriptional regulator
LREAAYRLFLQQGYQATSIEAILAEAGISSKETLYRHYASKEALFVDVLGHLTMEQPGFVERMATWPVPYDFPSLQYALTRFAHEIVAMMSQPGYLSLVRMILTESARFPQLSRLFFSTVTQRGISVILTYLQVAREKQVIADLDLAAVAHTLLGGLVASVLMGVALEGKPDPQMSVDAVIEVVMRALTPTT